MADIDLLRQLHDTYVWHVNAAVGEGRMDLVWRLSDEYADQALQLMTEMESRGCGRGDCVICARGEGTSIESAPARRSWLGRAWRRHTV